MQSYLTVAPVIWLHFGVVPALVPAKWQGPAAIKRIQHNDSIPRYVGQEFSY